LVQTLYRIFLLNQITKLIIKHFDFPFGQFIDILYFTPHLHIFKSNFLSLDDIDPILIRTTDAYQIQKELLS